MAPRTKRKSALSGKSKVDTARSHRNSAFEGASDDLGLLPASETSEEGAQYAEDLVHQSLLTSEESIIFDIIQIQLDRQLQHELDFYIEQELDLAGQADNDSSPNRNRMPARRTTIFNLPEDDNYTSKKNSKKGKRHAESGHEVLPDKLQRARKKRRNTKMSEHE